MLLAYFIHVSTFYIFTYHISPLPLFLLLLSFLNSYSITTLLLTPMIFSFSFFVDRIFAMCVHLSTYNGRTLSNSVCSKLSNI